MAVDFLGKDIVAGGPNQGSVGWRSPSNIAIIKYWGKYGNQLPQNPSLSFTLSQAYTETRVDYKRTDQNDISIDFLFEGKSNKNFENRIEAFLKKNIAYFPFITSLHLKIESSNSFPHSSGIASSASSMSALCLCLMTLEQKLTESTYSPSTLLKKASFLSRLASGSASRSVYPISAIWGQHHAVNSHNEYATPFAKMHSVFKTFHDDILIVSKEEKKVSSTAGHALMEGNPFAKARYAQANERFESLLEILESGDVEAFGKIAEDEALTLHALMMCSDPSYVLMEPNTLSIINEIRAFREDHKLPVYFTLDAGPNIHLLYPDSIQNEVDPFIKEVLLRYCDNQKVIKDHVGSGPQEISTFTLDKS